MKLARKQTERTINGRYVDNGNAVDFVYTHNSVDSEDEDQRVTEKKVQLRCVFNNEWGRTANAFQLTFFQRIMSDMRCSISPILSVHSVRDPSTWEEINRMISAEDLPRLRRKFARGELSAGDLGPDGQNLLLAATSNIHGICPDVVELFIHQGVDINQMSYVDDEMGSPLDLCYLPPPTLKKDSKYYSNRSLCARMLLEAGAEVRFENQGHGVVWSASLVEVSTEGNLEDFEMLLSDSYNSTVDINDIPSDDDGSLLLHFLSGIEIGLRGNSQRTVQSYVDITNLLLAHGANINLRSKTDKGSSLHKLFTESYYERIYRDLDHELPAENVQSAVLRTLIEAGADIYATDAILFRHPEDSSNLYIGTVTEAAYMAGLQNSWWKALFEAKGADFDQELYLEQESCVRGIGVAEYKQHLKRIWLLFRRLLYLDDELQEEDWDPELEFNGFKDIPLSMETNSDDDNISEHSITIDPEADSDSSEADSQGSEKPGILH
ncbi:hypothetical protein ABW19_dt0200667 [Dactylella cylindrospora]|nr:hypothetical protein ABW19_dt0200667 [Dactylella cylindrospora]